MQNHAACGQLDLLFSHTDGSLTQYLEKRLDKAVSVVLTDNASSILSARMHDNVLRVRLHRMFLNADDGVMSEIVSYLKNKRGAMPHFRSFVRDNSGQLGQKPPRKVLVRTAGRYHDLCGLYDELNEEYFGGAVDTVITWGTRSPRSSVRKRTVGSYSERSNTIRINPMLDRKTVPRCYVAFIVYHEMLHAAQEISIRGKRRSIHSREFRTREKLFKDYERAMAWENGKA